MAGSPPGPDRAERVPRRSLAISLVALVAPVLVAVYLPDARTEYEILLWLFPLIPAFLLAYHRGWRGAALALAFGMVALTASQIAATSVGRYPDDPTGWITAVAAFVAVALGIGWTSELLHRRRAGAEAEWRAAAGELAASHAALQAIVFAAPVAVTALNREGNVIMWNPAAERLFGWTAGEVLGRPDPLVPPELQAEHRETRLRSLRGEVVSGVELRRVRKDGVPLDLVLHTAPLRDAAGTVRGTVGILVDLTERKRADALAVAQKNVLELVATGRPLVEVLTALVRMVEEQIPGVLGSILLADQEGRTLRLGAAPDLPEEYNREVDGIPVAPRAGSCGTAAHRRRPVIVPDIATDPLWEGFRDGALRAGLRSCWSVPVLARDGRVLGTFALYARDIREPTPEELRVLEVASPIAGIAIERVRAEEALRQSEARFRSIFEQSRDAIYVTTREGAFLEANPAALELLGYSWNDLLSMNARDLYVDPSTRDRFRHEIERRGSVVDFELRLRRKDGREIDCLLSSTLRREADGTVAGYQGIIRDITRQKRAERELRESEERFRIMFERAALGIVMVDPQGRSIAANPAFQKMLGYSLEELGEIPIASLTHPEDWPENARLLRALEAGEIDHFQMPKRYIRKDGTTLWAHLTASTIRDEAGRPLFSIALVEDLSERRQAEEQNRAVLATALDGFCLADTDGRLLDVNAALCTLLGYTREDLLAMRLRDLEPQDIDPANALGHVLEAGRDRFETRLRTRSGRYVEVEASVNYLDYAGGRLFAFFRDITERKMLEEQLLQAQKMEAVGRLAGGIAHDFNNILTAIQGHVHLLLEEPEARPVPRTDLLEIRDAADRAANLTRQLLAFGRKQVLQPRLLDLNAVIADMGKMLQRVIGEDIELHTVLAPDLGRVRADPGQLQQVIMNLAVNARDAMPRGGRLTLETANAELDAEGARMSPDAEPGPHVAVTVSDTGAGIAPEILPRIFEPFFTTKERGQGTGLGLSTVYGIVRQSGGHVRVESEPGRGTTIRILLPRVSDVAPAAVRTERTASRARGGHESILLVEDEAAVRSLISRVLRRHGYRVLVAEDGPSALELARAHPGPIDLLLTDVIMPGMSGRELARHLEAERPGLRILYVSGYSEREIVHRGALEAGITLLEKPFTPDALVRKVREILDAGTAAAPAAPSR